MLLARMLAIALVALASVPTGALAQIRAVTQDGKSVILSPNGTWKYADAPIGPNISRAPNATASVEGKRIPYKVWYDPAKWQVNQRKMNDRAEHELRHTNGDAYAVVIAERLEVPLNRLTEIALENARRASPDASLVSSSERFVNGVRVAYLQINGTTQGIPFTYFGSYYAGRQGSIQILTYTGRNLFDEYKPDLEEFLRGFTIE